MKISVLDAAAVGRPITRLGVSFFPVYLAENRIPSIATGKNSGLVIEELPSAAVPELLVRNPTGRPVLIVEGEHFVGGDQNRAVNASVLVPAKTKLKIPVSCLERGRWGRRRAYERSESHAPWAVRSKMRETVNASMLCGNSRFGDQHAVWGEVDELLRRTGARSATSAAEDAERFRRRDRSWDYAVEELAGAGPLSGQNGIVVAHGTRVTAVDLFGSPDLLEAHWSALARSHMLETPRKAPLPSSDSALWALRRLAAATSYDSPGVGLGTERHLTDRFMVGQILELDGMIVHGSAFAKNRNLEF